MFGGRFLWRPDLVGPAAAWASKPANWRFFADKSEEIKAKPKHEN
jgi:hypothetical protein